MKFRLLAASAAVTAMAFAMAACDQTGATDEAAEAAMEEPAAETEMAAAEPAAEEPAAAAPAGPPAPPSQLAIDTIGGGASIDVTLPDILGDNGEVERRFTGYGENISPAIEWTPVDGAQTYALIFQDPVAMADGSTFVVLHWAAYNIPGTSLPEGLPAGQTIEGGGMQAANLMGNVGYSGPRPPANRPQHQYTWQVFALDTTLDVPAEVTYDGLLAAMQGHVIGSGAEVTPYSPPPEAEPMPGVSLPDDDAAPEGPESGGGAPQ